MAADESSVVVIDRQLSLNDVCLYNIVYTRVCAHIQIRDTHAG